MALYRNGTRYPAIVTLKITAVQDPKEALEVGVPSVKTVLEAEVGVLDVLVGPGEAIELKPGVAAEFLSARSVL